MLWRKQTQYDYFASGLTANDLKQTSKGVICRVDFLKCSSTAIFKHCLDEQMVTFRFNNGEILLVPGSLIPFKRHYVSFAHWLHVKEIVFCQMVEIGVDARKNEAEYIKVSNGLLSFVVYHSFS